MSFFFLCATNWEGRAFAATGSYKKAYGFQFVSLKWFAKISKSMCHGSGTWDSSKLF